MCGEYRKSRVVLNGAGKGGVGGGQQVFGRAARRLAFCKKSSSQIHAMVLIADWLGERSISFSLRRHGHFVISHLRNGIDRASNTT